MIARFDHRPMLTALLALTTIVLLVVVVTLSTLLITAPPQAVAPTSGSVDDNPTYPADYSEVYGHEWNNYGHNLAQPKPAQTHNGADLSAIDRHLKMVAAYKK